MYLPVKNRRKNAHMKLNIVSYFQFETPWLFFSFVWTNFSIFVFHDKSYGSYYIIILIKQWLLVFTMYRKFYKCADSSKKAYKIKQIPFASVQTCFLVVADTSVGC